MLISGSEKMQPGQNDLSYYGTNIYGLGQLQCLHVRDNSNSKLDTELALVNDNAVFVNSQIRTIFTPRNRYNPAII